MKNKVVIVTDSNSGITQSEAKELGISVLPMFILMKNYFMKILPCLRKNFMRS